MGFYREKIVPRVINTTCGSGKLAAYRRRVCAGLAGDVIEIGFGSGLNVPYYPAAVDRVAAVEPAEVAWRLAAGRIAASGVRVDRAGLDGQSLPFGDASFDTALCTWTLCTIPDAAVALEELRRVLKPGGTLHLVEHGIAPDEKVQRLQRRLDPLQRRLCGGCRLTRPVAAMVTSAGFTFIEVDVFYDPNAAKFNGAYTLGVATVA